MSFLNFIQLLGGVGMFLFAIKMISESLQLIAGDKLRHLLGVLTRTPLLGVLVGAGVTILIQSSSATTVMTVSFVNAGLMNLSQAIGVIMGANIGTTVTGQILAFKISDYAYAFIISGVLMTLICKKKKYTYLGNGMIGFGLLFVGMQTMESSMSFLKTRQDLFLAFSQTPLMGLAAGTLLTLLVQSSAATVGLTMALGMQGLLPLEAAIPIILGDNIGTTITAVLASFGTNRAARQACAAHVLFNVIGVCIFMPLMPLYIDFIVSSADSIAHQIANAHTLFNVCNTLLFLPFVKVFAILIRWLIPAEGRKGQRERFLDYNLITYTPVMAVGAVRNECQHVGELVLDMLRAVERAFFLGKPEEADKVAEYEEELDRLNRNVQNYGQAIIRTGIGDADMAQLQRYLASTGDMERVGDKCMRLISFYHQLQTREGDFTSQALEELHVMFDDARTAFALALEVFEPDAVKHPPELHEVHELAVKVRSVEMSLRVMQLNHLNKRDCEPTAGLIFIDILGAIENIAYRAQKMAYVHSAKKPTSL